MSPKEYARAIERVLQSGIATEHSHRPALKAFIESLAPGVCVINEPKSVACGAPDLIVQQGSVPLGYIEAKDIGKSLDHEEKSEQLKRYREGLRNLILTDYLDFRWYVRGELRLTARLAKADSKGKLRPVHNGYFEVLALLNEFLRGRASAVADPRELAKRLAGLARLIRESILKTFGHEAKNGTLHALFEGFRRVLIADLTGEQFADMYAQTICYGLFAARCRHEGPAAFTRESAAYDLPRTNPFLREVFSQIAGPGLDEQLVWVVDDLVSLLDRADMASILKDFGKRTRQEDPVLHFYETFLGEYDAALREKRGVYYTPEPVVSYIVRSVDEILKRQFALRDGLADCSTVDVLVTGANPDGKTTRPHKVIVLDPAVGTGTFLRTVIDHIHEHVLAKGMGGAWSSYVSQHLLPRLFGFELLMAPYAVCHMKLAIELEETGYDFTSNERLHVYLTNSLEEAHERPDPQLFAQVLAREAREASDIKQSKPVMVVLGNPPYSGHSANKGDWIKNLLRQRLPQGASGYFEVDGKPLGERNPKWLNDDYVKFIRFAQWRIEQSGYGILAFVSNHGYLDNPTFRGMRRSLLETFDEIYVLDLHGNSKKREHAPDGSKDENVFDIQQGVAIGIFVKRETRRTAPAHVFHAELWGPREVCKQGAPSRDPRISGKYQWLAENDLSTTAWSAVNAVSPLYGFKPSDEAAVEEYRSGWRLPDIMKANVLGFQTHRDHFAIDFDASGLRERLEEMRGVRLSDSEFAEQYGVQDKSDWVLRKAREELRSTKNWEQYLTNCLYRPFDQRACFFSKVAVDRPRRELQYHVFRRENLCLLAPRRISGLPWQHTFCCVQPASAVSLQVKEGSYVFPIYLYPQRQEGKLLEDDRGEKRRPNISEAFLDDVALKLGLRYVTEHAKGDGRTTFGPEEVLAYIYAVLHAPSYRKRYAEFLKSDFPRIPLTSNAELFCKLCSLGRELVGLHLMEKRGPELASFPVGYDATVERVRYAEPTGQVPGRVWINSRQFFEGLSPDVWAFHVGGYQVCEKWLKDRKGRALSWDDVRHYQGIVGALSETIRLMAEVDATIEAHGGWPLQSASFASAA